MKELDPEAAARRDILNDLKAVCEHDNIDVDDDMSGQCSFCGKKWPAGSFEKMTNKPKEYPFNVWGSDGNWLRLKK